MACYFVDVDNTLVKGGTEELLDGVLEKMVALKREGHRIWLFTCRPDGPWTLELKNQGVPFDGVMHKPFNPEGYVVIDDMLLEGRQAL